MPDAEAVGDEPWSSPQVIIRKQGYGIAYPHPFELEPGRIWLSTQYCYLMGLTFDERDFVGHEVTVDEQIAGPTEPATGSSDEPVSGVPLCTSDVMHRMLAAQHAPCGAAVREDLPACIHKRQWVTRRQTLRRRRR